MNGIKRDDTCEEFGFTEYSNLYKDMILALETGEPIISPLSSAVLIGIENNE